MEMHIDQQIQDLTCFLVVVRANQEQFCAIFRGDKLAQGIYLIILYSYLMSKS